MSLRSKVIGTLLGVFFLYALFAWLALEVVYTSAFDSLENDKASKQLSRITRYIDAERADMDLLVHDWANWNETFEYAKGDYEGFYEENLAEAYLGELGMSFGAVVDAQGSLVWGEVYPATRAAKPLDFLFPDGIQKGSALLSPTTSGELVSGFIDTAWGAAIVSSSAIFKSSGLGTPSGHLIMGKLLDTNRMDIISETMLTSVNILPTKRSTLPEQFHQALNELMIGDKQVALVKYGDNIHALSLLRDVGNQHIGLLRVVIPADISSLGTSTLHTTISALIIAALLITLTIWLTLKSMLLAPIEHLTGILRSRGNGHSDDENGQYLLSTVQRLVDSRGSISKRNDEIGELIGAFDELSSSLSNATTSVWRVAHIDGLTGLANRRLFMDRLTGILDTASEDSPSFSVLFIDLDNFKTVNDTHGHKIGDQLLIEVANRLQAVVGADSKVIGPEDDVTRSVAARIGGDEFVLFLPSNGRPEHASNIASSIVQSIGSPYLIEGISCQIGACVGMAVYPEDADGVDGILSKADSALYEAKRAGTSCWRRYVPGLSRSGEQKSA
jgi:diguanylate cyclase (GGDEF)-like protein